MHGTFHPISLGKHGGVEELLLWKSWKTGCRSATYCDQRELQTSSYAVRRRQISFHHVIESRSMFPLLCIPALIIVLLVRFLLNHYSTIYKACKDNCPPGSPDFSHALKVKQLDQIIASCTVPSDARSIHLSSQLCWPQCVRPVCLYASLARLHLQISARASCLLFGFNVGGGILFLSTR